MIRVRLGLYPLLNGLLGWTSEATLDGLVIVSQFTIHILQFEKLPVSIQHQRCAQPSSATLSSSPRAQRLTPLFLISVVLLPLILIAVASQPQVTLKTRFPCLKLVFCQCFFWCYAPFVFRLTLSTVYVWYLFLSIRFETKHWLRKVIKNKLLR